MRIITVSNQKGGVGKTTLSFNLAWWYAKQGKRTLAVDLDPQGSLTGSSFGIDRADLSQTIGAVLTKAASIQDVAIKIPGADSLYLLPANGDLVGIDLFLSAKPKAQFVLRKTLQSVKSVYDVVVIDTPPSVSLFSLNGWYAADLILIPCTPEPKSLDGLDDMLEDLADEKIPMYVLVNQFDSRAILYNDVSEAIRARGKVGLTVLQSTIHKSVMVSEAELVHCPVWDYAPDHKVTLQFKSVMQEVTDGEKKIS